MTRCFFAFVLLLLTALAGAQQAHVHGGQPVAAFMPPDMNMPAGKIYIDTKTIPKKKTGTDKVLVTVGCGPLSSTATHNASGFQVVDECANSLQVNIIYGDFGGGARFKCNISHWSFDDPIVKPGQAGMTHLHQFFGNTTTDSQSDVTNMANVGKSTCSGGVINRTGYWTPVWVYHCPPIEVGCNRLRNGTVFPAFANLPYYKYENPNIRYGEAPAGSAGDAQRASAVALQRAITWWPVGFRMIMGDPNNLIPENIPGRFDCFWTGPQTTGYSFNHAPNSAQAAAANTGSGCTEINMLIWFPTCRANDQSILYLPTPVGGRSSGHVDGWQGQLGVYRGCPTPGFSVPSPELTYNIHTHVLNNADWDYMVLSSDQPARGLPAQSGSTTTQIKLPASENPNPSTYIDGAIMWNGQRRYITAYDGATRTATVSPAFSTAPPAGATVGVRYPGGLSAHGDWVNGWSERTDIPLLQGKSVTQQIIRNCYRDEIRYGAIETNPTHLNCEVNLLGDPSPSTNAWPRVGGTQLYLPLP